MDAVDTGYIYHKRKNARQQVNTENKKTAAARPQGGGFFEATSVHVNDFQKLFLMIDLDVCDRLGHV